MDNEAQERASAVLKGPVLRTLGSQRPAESRGAALRADARHDRLSISIAVRVATLLLLPCIWRVWTDSSGQEFQINGSWYECIVSYAHWAINASTKEEILKLMRFA